MVYRFFKSCFIFNGERWFLFSLPEVSQLQPLFCSQSRAFRGRMEYHVLFYEEWSGNTFILLLLS